MRGPPDHGQADRGERRQGQRTEDDRPRQYHAPRARWTWSPPPRRPPIRRPEATTRRPTDHGARPERLRRVRPAPSGSGWRAPRPPRWAGGHPHKRRTQIEDQGHQETDGGDHGDRSRIGQGGRCRPTSPRMLCDHRPTSEHPDHAGRRPPRRQRPGPGRPRPRSRSSRRAPRGSRREGEDRGPERKEGGRALLGNGPDEPPGGQGTETDDRRPWRSRFHTTPATTREHGHDHHPEGVGRVEPTVPVHGGGQDADHHGGQRGGPLRGTWRSGPAPELLVGTGVRSSPVMIMGWNLPLLW